MEQLRLLVPIYNGRWIDDPEQKLPEFTEDKVHVVVVPDAGVRVVLGTHNYEDYRKPDIQIERRNNGWVVFLHPLGGDPSGCVVFIDDGRSFFMPECIDGFELIKDFDEVPELDDIRA